MILNQNFMMRERMSFCFISKRIDLVAYKYVAEMGRHWLI